MRPIRKQRGWCICPYAFEVPESRLSEEQLRGSWSEKEFEELFLCRLPHPPGNQGEDIMARSPAERKAAQRQRQQEQNRIAVR